MKITPQILHQRVKGPLNDALHLDLSGLGIGAIEQLELFPNLESIDLSSNCLEDVENFEHCKNLWRFNLSDNKICCVRNLSKMFAIGTLDLSNNDLSWNELLRLRHVFILDLRLYGNELLENDTYYRIHVIDCLPNVWVLDGRLVTSAERLQVQQFFEDSALSQRPVRHKFDEKSFFKAITSEPPYLHGTRTAAFSSNFPVKEKHNRETDKRRLSFLAYNIEKDLKNQKKSMKRHCNYLTNDCLQIIIEKRSNDREKCNMLLLLLIASIEFELPENLIDDVLVTAKLNPLFGVDTLQLFRLDFRTRTEVISLLVSSCKLDREIDKSNAGGLYDRLYLSLYHSVSYLLQKTSKSKKKNWIDKTTISSRPTTASSYYSHVAEPKSSKNHVRWKDHRTLLASELTLLLSVVPSFYEHILINNPKVYNLLLLATGDDELHEKLSEWTEAVLSSKGDTNTLCKEICKSVITRLERARESSNAMPGLHGGSDNSSRPQNHGKSSGKSTQTDLILNTSEAYPKRPKSAVLVSGERLTHAKKYRKNWEFINMVKSYDMQHLNLGSYVLLGPQNLARVVALPEPHIALVQMNLIPTANGSVRVFAKDMDEHYCYVDVRKLTYDYVERYWKPRGAIGDTVTLQLDDETEVLSVAEQKALKRGTTSGSVSSYSRKMVAYSAGLHRVDPSSSSFTPCVPPVSLVSFLSKESSKELVAPGPATAQALSPQPLSSAYCEKMELSFPEITFLGSQHPHLSEVEEATEEYDSAVDSYRPSIADFESELERSELERELAESSIPTIDDSAQGLNDDETDVEPEKRDPLIEENAAYLSFEDKEIEQMKNTNFKKNDQHDSAPANLNEDEEKPPISALNDTDSNKIVDQECKDLESDLKDQLQIIDQNQRDDLSKYSASDDIIRSETSTPRPRNQEQEKNCFLTEQQDQVAEVEGQISKNEQFARNDETASPNERTYERKLRIKSAPETMLRSRFQNDSSTRPSSAAPPKKVLFCSDQTRKDDSRPGSASSFQLRRTEAWRSSASSVSTGLQQPGCDQGGKFTQFVVDNGRLTRNPRKKYRLKMRRPPPQRPTSPDHMMAAPVKNSYQQQYGAVSLPVRHSIERRSEPLLTARWLADGRDVHQENLKQKQQINARRVPGYLDHARLPLNLMKKKRYLTRPNEDHDNTTSKSIRPSSTHPYVYQGSNFASNHPSIKRALPFNRPMTSWYRPRSSTISRRNRVSSLPHGFLAKPFGR